MSIALFGEGQEHADDEPEEDQKQADADEEEDSSDDGNDDGDDDEDEDDEDPETIARRLGEQLWADIERARAGAVASATPATVVHRKSAREEAALATVKTVLAYAASDPLVRETLSSTALPGFADSNVLDMLKKISGEGRITRQMAGPLSQVLVKLAQSEVLFSPLPVLPLQMLKRKRDEKDAVTPPATKRA